MPAHRSCRRAKPKYIFSDDEDEDLSASDVYSNETLPKPPLPVIPPPRSSHTRKRPPTYIRRPRNAFIIFRSDFCERQKMKESGIETDHRHISRIAAHVWNNLPEDEKEVYKERAEAEKLAHREAYPEYRYTPVGKPQQVKRKVKRDNTRDEVRCRQLAELVISGVEGRDLQHAAQALADGAVDVELTHRTSQPAPKRKRDRRRGPRLATVERATTVEVAVKEESPSPPRLGSPSPLPDTDQDSRGSPDDFSTPVPSSSRTHSEPKSTQDVVFQSAPHYLQVDEFPVLPMLSDDMEPDHTPNPYMRPSATSNLTLASLCYPDSAPPTPTGAINVPLPTSSYTPLEDAAYPPWPESSLPFPAFSYPPPPRSPSPPGNEEVSDGADTPTRRSPSPVTLSPWKPGAESEALLAQSTDELCYPDEDDFAEYLAGV